MIDNQGNYLKQLRIYAPPFKCLFETLKGSLAPDVITPEPVDGLNGVWKLK